MLQQPRLELSSLRSAETNPRSDGRVHDSGLGIEDVRVWGV